MDHRTPSADLAALLEEHRALEDRLSTLSGRADAGDVLAAGRTIGSPEQVRREVAFALENIKPCDILLLGMYQQFQDQIGENAALVAELCRGCGDLSLL